MVSIGSLLYQFLFMPLQFAFEEIYFFAYELTGHPGLSIIALSLFMNLLVLPLYDRADAMQAAERDMEAKLAKGVAHIKKTFKGDEQLMMLETYYRQNHYSPTSILKGSISLFLEIPFFVAAYQFLSHLPLLSGVSLGPITDLSQPDGLLTVAGLTINVLPILMTVINLISSYLFAKGYPLKTKIQLNVMALFFLVFLYASPAGLVFYWTLNNLFNLVKTIIYKLRHPMRVAYAALGLCSAVLFGGVCAISDQTAEHMGMAFGACLVLNVPALLALKRRLFPGREEEGEETPAARPTFLAGSLFLAILTGLLIPSAVMGSSPQEFIVPGVLPNPLAYLASAFAFSLGFCLLWPGVFYWLAKPSHKGTFAGVVWGLAIAAVVDYMAFGRGLGLLSPTLQYEKGFYFTWQEGAVNAAVLVAVAVAAYFLWKRFSGKIPGVLATACLAALCMAGWNGYHIEASAAAVAEDPTLLTGKQLFSLSRHGKNVIVFMLDRALGEYAPYIFAEKPDLARQFSGFTYYDNVISFGGHTNFGTPPLFGGYEYTPVEMNRRKDMPLKEKHDEALKVMPVLFDRAGYHVTVCDPPYAGYQWIPDLSIYDGYPRIRAYNTIGHYGKGENEEQRKAEVTANMRNFSAFALMKCLPLPVQYYFYDEGQYHSPMENEMPNQVTDGLYVADHKDASFVESYNVLTHLPDMTGITDEGSTFLMMMNDTPHKPSYLQEPEYVPADHVDNTDYERTHQDRFTLDGKKISMHADFQMAHYQANMAALLAMGKWFDYMRENGVYDNTRIIIVADHGYNIGSIPSLTLDHPRDTWSDTEFYFPLLMVKDFGSSVFQTSHAFMTNADVPSLAVAGLFAHPENPFTGKPINMEEKTAHPQYILASDEWDVDTNNGNTFLPDRWYSVHDDRWDMKNWELVTEHGVLP